MKRKVLAYILAAAVTVTGIVQTDATAFAHNTTDAATERSGESTEDVIDVTDAVKALEELRKALIDAQCQAEYLYINGDLRQSLE